MNYVEHFIQKLIAELPNWGANQTIYAFVAILAAYICIVFGRSIASSQ